MWKKKRLIKILYGLVASVAALTALFFALAYGWLGIHDGPGVITEARIPEEIISEREITQLDSIKKLDKKVKLPEYKTTGSSGLDLTAFIEKKIIIKPGENALVPTGISIAIPEDTEVQVRPRSGLAAKNNISVLNTPGTIDSDYRGEIKVILFNHGDKDFTVNNGDRIAQMILMPILKVDFETVETLPGTIRGSGGFGSTGK